MDRFKRAKTQREKQQEIEESMLYPRCKLKEVHAGALKLARQPAAAVASARGYCHLQNKSLLPLFGRSFSPALDQ